jgi:hypothetical protein
MVAAQSLPQKELSTHERYFAQKFVEKLRMSRGKERRSAA